MKKWYIVSFQWAINSPVFCTNMAHSATLEAVEKHYISRPWVNIREAQEWEVQTNIRKGMPIVEL